MLQGRKANGQRPTAAKGAQPHIHPKHKAIHRHLIQHFNQLLSQADKKLLMTNTARPALSLTTLRVDKHQIHIRGQVQLSSS